MTRDQDRSQVYVAEDACLVGTAFAAAPGPTVLAAALHDVFVSPWWLATVGGVPARVTFADNRGSGFYRHDDRRIHLGRAAPWLVAAHELAHMTAAHDGLRSAAAAAHDSRFCGWEVVVFRALFGAAASDVLASGFRSLGVQVAMPAATLAIPVEPLWQRYVPRIVRGGWRPPPVATGTIPTQSDPIPLG